jgi:hypothetical protein
MKETVHTGATEAHKPGTLSRLFIDRLNYIEERANKIGMTMTHICRESGVARATPDRWRASTPLTLQLIDKMEAAVAEAEKAKAGE